MVYVDGFPGRLLSKAGKTYRYFGGTAYLGLQTDPVFLKLYTEALQKYGTTYSASRKSNVRFSVYEEAETLLAELAGSEACLTLSSGYLAGQLVSAHFSTPAYRSFYAPDTHPALHRERTENYVDYNTLRQAITTHLRENPSVLPVLYVDTITFNGKGYPDYKGLRTLPTEHLLLVADDSHGFGITGAGGGGSYRLLKELNSRELIVCGSLGKGFGIAAGGILGSKTFIKTLTETEFFGASSPAAPHAPATFLRAQSLYEEKRALLLQNIQLFKEKIETPEDFQALEKYPVFSYTDNGLSDHLLEQDIIVTHFKYPNENAGTISKIVLSAHHTGTDIVALSEAVNRYPTKRLR